MTIDTGKMNVLTHWDIECRRGYFYCTGRLNGRDWITSSITELVTSDDCYIVYTENSIYYLYW